MANNDGAFGLRPVNGIGSGTFSGKVSRYVFLVGTGTAAYVGGLVKPAGSANADGVMDVTGNVSTGNAVLGVIVAIEPVNAESLTYRAASTLRFVYVADDPNQLFEVQEDSDSGALVANDTGNVADLTGFTAGSTVYGTSTIEIDSSTKTASGDGSEDVILIGLAQRPDNAIGNQAKWLVRLNNHFFVDAQAGA